MNNTIKKLAQEAGFDFSQQNLTIKELSILLEKFAHIVAKDTAKECMQSIVANSEHNGFGENAWWTIKDSYDIEINTQNQLLPKNRTTPPEIDEKWSTACLAGDIPEIKDCLKKGARIYNGNKDMLLRVCEFGSVETVKFFIEQKAIHHQYIDMHKNKDEYFTSACVYENWPVITYFIMSHDIENSKDIQTYLKNISQTENLDTIAKVNDIIASKEMAIKLGVQLPDKNSNIKKLKI